MGKDFRKWENGGERYYLGVSRGFKIMLGYVKERLHFISLRYFCLLWVVMNEKIIDQRSQNEYLFLICKNSYFL